jgi:hypothetical protein
MAIQYAIAVDYRDNQSEISTYFLRFECDVLKIFAGTYNHDDILFVRNEKEVTYFSQADKEMVEGLVRKLHKIFPNDISFYHKFTLVTVKNGWLYKEDALEEFFK